MVFDTLLGEISRNGSEAANKMKEIRSKLGNAIVSLLTIGQKEGLVDKDIDVNLHAHIMLATFTGMLLHWFVHENPLMQWHILKHEILKGLGIKMTQEVKKSQNIGQQNRKETIGKSSVKK